jgi:ketosteroid isomerase-like protein
MKHPNAATLEKLYSHFAQGDMHAVLALCAEQVTFQVPGKSKLAGKYTKADFEQGFAMKLRELSGGTFKLEVHDILASDLHAAVLATQRLTRAGKPVEFRTVHIWRFEAGKPVAWYEYPRDLYQFDTVWA